MEAYEIFSCVQKIVDKIKEEYKTMQTLNVMVLGKTGAGKSTLINNMFNQNLAETGVGKPITQQIRKITKPEFPLAIYDTPGLELGGENAINSLLEEVTGEIERGINSGNISEAIHCIWYCVSTPSHRFEQAEIDFLKEFLGETSKRNVPVIIVLTQAYSKKDAQTLKAEIEKENLPVVNVVPVLADDYDIDGEYVAKAYGLDKLSEIMDDTLSDAIQKTFASVQKANLKIKRKRAQTIVAAAAAAAAATGAAPIPFSDAAALVPEQMVMIARITAIFGLKMEKAAITSVISATIGAAGTTILGKTIVANLIKFIPGVGSVTGGVISGTTAAALTAALGEAYITIMTMICKGELSTDDLSTETGKEKIKRIFTERLKLKRNKKGELIEDAEE